MKNLLLRHIPNVQKSILYIMSISLFAFLFFITLIYEHKTTNTDSTSTSLIGGVIAFIAIFGLLFQLNKDIVLRNTAKDELSASELKYRNLIENAGVVMYTTTLNGVINFASSKAFALTGYNTQELAGMHFTDIVDEEWLQRVIDKYKFQVKANVEETVLEFCMRTKYGDQKWVEQSAVLIREHDLPVGFHCVVKDISEKKEMEKVVRDYEIELILKQDRLQSILDNTKSLIYIKDLDGKYLLTNKQFREALNVDDNIIGRTDFELSTDSQAKRFKDTDDEVIKTGKPVSLEDTLQMPDGLHNILINKFPLLDSQNNIYGISGIATDITERVKDREQLVQAKQVAEDAKKMQEQFLANMSHEIRTPMNGIQGMTDLLLETNLNNEQKDFAKTIKRSSDNLLVIINDILDFSKIKAGKLTIEKIDFKLTEVIENIKAIFKHRINEKDLLLQINVHEDVPVTLNGDPYRLNQILVNLIGNAIKFTESGSIHVNITIQKQTSKEIILHFSIADTGIGIQSDKLDEMFESFTQASIETSRKYGGTGLGLSITKQLVEMQKGQISVESKLDTGTTFSFSIPYNFGKNETQSFFAGKGLTNYRSLLKGKKFLVAEDNEVNQKVIRHVLQKAGGIVDIANNGLEAVAFLKKSMDYNLIIMDLQMPEMNGYEATKYIRNVMKLSIPIIAMTASALKGEKSKCMEIGMNDYLSKPFDFSFVYKRISMLLDNIPLTDNVTENKKNNNENLFDLCLLEEMDDNEYVSEILTIFLNNTQLEMDELQKACKAGDFDLIYKIAHKLKSSTGLLKANGLLDVLIKLENTAKDKKNDGLTMLAQSANEAYKKIETPLQEHLKNINAALAV